MKHRAETPKEPPSVNVHISANSLEEAHRKMRGLTGRGGKRKKRRKL